MSALVKQIQDALVAYLAGRSELTGVSVLGRREKNIVNDVAAAIQRTGVCIYVFPALPVELNSNNPGPYCDKIEVRVRVHEHPQLNRSLPDAYELTELVVRLLDNQQFTAVAGLNPLFWDGRPVQPAEDENLVIFDVIAFTSCGFTPLGG
jgi:hypothetical protein